jgi:uncharacterized membrane protein
MPPDATPTTEGGMVAPEPPIDLMNDEPELPEPELVDFHYYGKVIAVGIDY